MALELDVWRIDGATPTRIVPTQLDQESRLEDYIAHDVSLVREDLWIIGRQVPTAHGHFIDLLAIDTDGNLTVLELKRNRTPRDVVAQILDYGSWAKQLAREEVVQIYENFVRKHRPDLEGVAFEVAFEQRFGGSVPDIINEAHELIIVAARLDDSTERIVEYLGDFNVPVNAVFFRVFRDGQREYLTRAWLRDPTEAQVRTEEAQAQKKGKEPWNGADFYVSYGGRSWADAVQYGFVSAGGGRWHSRTLRQLQPGHRIFVHIPKVGYVGVGRVTSPAVPASEFVVQQLDGTSRRLADLPLGRPEIMLTTGDEAELAVGVEWIRTKPESEAIWEDGMFANQNSACRLRSRFTIERLTEKFALQQRDE